MIATRRPTRDSGIVFVCMWVMATTALSCGGGGSTDNTNPTSPSAPTVTSPSIQTQPQPATVTVGQTATFSVTASGTAPLVYQWQKNSSAIPTATSASYTTGATAASDSGSRFSVTITNGAGTVSSSVALLSVTTPAVAPTIVTQPQSVVSAAGQPATFTVTAGGTAPFTYQWKSDNIPIVGATASNYAIPAAFIADSGSTITVTISNAAGSITSNPVALTVTGSRYGLGGFMAVFPDGTSDITGVRFRVKVIEDQTVGVRIVFGYNRVYTPGAGLTYITEYNTYADRYTFSDSTCTTWPLAGAHIDGQSSVRVGLADYADGNQQPGPTVGMRTGDAVNYPIQTYLVDGIANLYKSDAISQFNMNGVEALVTMQRGGTVTDVSAFSRCGRPLLPGTYRVWTFQTQIAGMPTATDSIVIPDGNGRYIVQSEALNFASELLNQPGSYVVQYWDFAAIRESDPTWRSIVNFITSPIYDGTRSDFGVHVVNIGGMSGIEFSNHTGGTYLPRNTPFAF
jgi:hypothetical protein